MTMTRAALIQSVAVIALGLTGTALMAQPGMWGEPRWRGDASRGTELGEGPIEVSRFRVDGDAGMALAHGPIAVVAMPIGDEEGAARSSDTRFSAMFEAAVEDQLVHSGYDAATRDPQGGQVAEVRVIRVEAQPPEAPHRPVSGEMTMGVSNHGSMIGLGLRIDGTKPRGALMSTRLEARIRDRASGQVLWEGRAEVLTRAGDKSWDDQRIADKLSAGLFDGFPVKIGESSVRR